MKFKLINNTKYSAQITLGFLSKLASNDQVKSKLEEAGFNNIEVTGSGRERSASGVYIGDTLEVDLPSEISNIKPI